MSSSSVLSLVDIIKNHANTKPDDLCITFLLDGENESETCTYRQLDEGANKLAGILRSKANPGDRVLLLYPSGIEFMKAFLGCLYAGLIAVPAFPPTGNRNDERIHAIISDCKPQLLLTDRDTLALINAKMEIKRPNSNDDTLRQKLVERLIASDALLEEAVHSPPASILPSDVAFLQYTSGSVGNPKGVMVTHANLLENLAMINRTFGIASNAVVVSWLPMFHDMGLVGALESLFIGASLVLMPHTTFIQKPLRWWKAVDKYKGTVTGGPNFAYNLSIKKIKDEDMHGVDLKTLRVLFNGAEPIQYSTLTNLFKKLEPHGLAKEAFLPCYGMAEATLLISGCLWNDKFSTTSHKYASINRKVELVSCGPITTQEEIIIVDPTTRRPLENVQEGEIWIRGKNVAKGYWNRSDLNIEVFDARIATMSQDDSRFSRRYMRTGDLGIIKDSQLYITGRLKDMVIINGSNHYAHDIEDSICKAVPEVRPGCIAAYTLCQDDEEGVGVVAELDKKYRNDDFQLIAKKISDAVYADHHVVARRVDLVRHGHILKTTSGKIRRQANMEAIYNSELSVIYSMSVSREPSKECNVIEIANIQVPRRPTGPIGVVVKREAALKGVDVFLKKHHSIEHVIALRLSEQLKIPLEKIEYNKRFSDLGMDSVSLMEFAGCLEEELNIRITERDLFECGNITLLADYLKRISHIA